MSCLVIAVNGGAFWGMWSPPGVDIDGELSTSMRALLNLTWGQSFLPWDAHLVAESSWYLGTYSWPSCYVRWRWDRFHTQVHTIRCAWVPVARSIHARRLRPPLPDARSGQRLSICGKPQASLTEGLSPCPRSMREAGGVDRWWNLICLC
jgi:hypothetical protein